MNAIRPEIIVLTSLFLLQAPVSLFAQTNNRTTAAYPNNAAIASYSNAPALSLQDLSFSPNQAQINFQEQANPTFSDVPALWRQDLGLSTGLPQASTHEQATAAFPNGTAVASGRDVRALKESETQITGTIPVKLSDFKITPPSLLAMPIKNEVPVRVDTTWRSQ